MGSARRFETFSYLPPPSARVVEALAAHVLRGGGVPAVEHSATGDVREAYWRLWKLPLFDARAPADVLAEIDACAAAHPESYVRLTAYDVRRQRAMLSVVVRRP